MRLEELEILTVVETIKYRTFKEKIDITKKYGGKARIQIYDNYVYLEKKRYVS